MTRTADNGVETRGNDAVPQRGSPVTGIDVDGSRPAVEWVTSLPKEWRVTSVQRLVLMAIACDSFDGRTSAPGWDHLAAWTGIEQRDVRKYVVELTRRTDHRPALLAKSGTGGRGRRAMLTLLREKEGAGAPHFAQKPGEKPGENPGAHSPTSLALSLNMEEGALSLISALVECIAEGNPGAARRVEHSAEVLEAARAAHGAGRTPEDVRRAWREKPGPIEYPVGFALKVFNRVASGERLPERKVRPPRRFSIRAGTVEEHGPSRALTAEEW